MEKFDDDKFIAKYREGDLSALGVLYDRYSGPLYGYLMRITGSREEADDILQDTFCKLIEKLERYHPRGKFKSYIFRIAHNLAIDNLRKRRFREDGDMEHYEKRITTCAANPGISPKDPAQEVVEREIVEKLKSAIDKLPDEQKQVLIMKHYSGMKFREIAEAMEIPLNTALGRMHYALRYLRKMLAGMFIT
ncbi:MAG: sigma-70 family RNA polymerase sigma factor [Candidatus Eremiobacteraeota bacterium]|nr:sigma-70 family RNA polymerase sigma factor [Candidatus Eremiobacteraeota bacterium]